MNPPSPTPANAALLKKYHLQPAPESVARLGRLVAQSVDDNMDQIAKVVSGDPVLKARLLRAASPRKGAPLEDVEQAIFRCGVEAVLVLAMTDPLARAVDRTFDSLLGMALDHAEEATAQPIEPPGFVTTMSFTGRASGLVLLRIGEPLARRIASRLLALPPPDVAAADVVDAVGELGNVIVGNFQSNLCDAGLPCSLSIPKVGPIHEFRLPETRLGHHQHLDFRCEGMPLMLDIVIQSTD